MAEWMASRCRWMVGKKYCCALAGGRCRAFKACLALSGVKLYMHRKVELGHGSPCSRMASIYSRNKIMRTKRLLNEFGIT
jgi:hypothetical protein